MKPLRWKCPRAPALALGVLVLVSLSLLGCFERWNRPERAPGSALWLGRSSGTLETSALARLREAGLAELFVEVARWDPSAADGPLVATPGIEPPSGLPAQLVVVGELRSAEVDDDLASRVAAAARQLRFGFEGRGGLPGGLHLDFSAVDSVASLAELAGELRAELDPDLLLSVSVQRPWLDDEETVASLLGAVDFGVAFLYGQRVYEREESGAWDFIELENAVEKLERIGRPYLLGFVSLGMASHLDANGALLARTTNTSMAEVLWNRALDLKPGFSLEGVNRRVYTVVAERATAVGEWRIRPKQSLRVVRSATSDLEELLRLIDAWSLEHHLGQLYYRLPNDAERLSLRVENLLNALAPQPASPDLGFEAAVQRRTGRGWLMRFGLVNRNSEITELSLLDNNFLEVRVDNGTVARVDAGDFYRFDLYRRREGEEPLRTFRSPDLLRLHLPILGGEQSVSSGDVELRMRNAPQLELSGRFLLPDGRTIELGPVRWRDGAFVEPEPEAESAP